jgi:hypothetical protein
MSSQPFAWLLNFSLLLLAGQTVPSIASGADNKPSEVETVKFVLYPARSPAAALQYPLLPKFIDRTPGNAAPLYLKAELLLPHPYPKDFWENADAWLGTSPANLPKDKVRAALDRVHLALLNATIAAHRDRCEWDEPIRESKRPFSILLPEIYDVRDIGRLLALQARLQIAEGHLTEAIATLQTGYAMAKHVSECSFLVSGLVGQSIANLMTGQLTALIQSKDCPNLYWSLAMLPQPFIDYRPALDLEAASIYQEFPELRDAETAQRSPEEWQAKMADYIHHCESMRDMEPGNTPLPRSTANNILSAVVLLGLHSNAKAELIAAGRDPKQVEAMPPAQAILADIALRLDHTLGDGFKWYGVPYWQARDVLGASEKARRGIQAERILMGVASYVPQIWGIMGSQVRSERRMAALRIVESIRMYAATHDGKLPSRLDDLHEAPAPLDPVTGKSFQYRMADGKAVLEGIPPASGDALRYELTLAPIKK